MRALKSCSGLSNYVDWTDPFPFDRWAAPAGERSTVSRRRSSEPRAVSSERRGTATHSGFVATPNILGGIIMTRTSRTAKPSSTASRRPCGLRRQ